MKYPRGAVAVVCWCSNSARVALVTRSKPPNVNQWSLPGGKIDLGEGTMAAAERELLEETMLGGDDIRFSPAPFAVTDVIEPELWDPETQPSSRRGGFRYHYLIAQTFARFGGEASQLVAGDDAGVASWFTRAELANMVDDGLTTQEVVDVVARGVKMAEEGWL